MNGDGPRPAPRISVVVPTYRRPDLIARCLAALLAQEVEGGASRYEIVVVDDGHDEATRRAVAALTPDAQRGPALRYLRPASGRGPAVARNAGWRAARGELIAFTDDDTIPDRHWLREGEAALRAEADLAAVCGRVVVPPRDEPPTDHELMTRGLESAEFVTANAFVWRRALEQVGGFDERFRRAWREDSDLQFRLLRDAGRVVRRVDAATVVHPVRSERWGVSLRQQQNTFFDALLYKKHPREYRERIRRLPPWDYYAIVGATCGVAPAALALGHPRAAGLALAVAALLVLALAARRLRGTARTPAHVWEMLATSALIPFLSVYWRLRGALAFRARFL